MATDAIVSRLRQTAADAVRQLVQERREIASELAACRKHARSTTLVAVEGIEMFDDTLAALDEELPATVRETLRMTREAAGERLRAAGLEFFGTVGEALDLARHQVVSSLGVRSAGHGVVAEVLRCGVLFDGELLRAATVIASAEE